MAENTQASPSEPVWAKPSIGVYALGLFAVAMGVAWWAENDTALTLLTGAVVTNATTVINYYFGSSAGSARKTEQMQANATGANPP